MSRENRNAVVVAERDRRLSQLRALDKASIEALPQESTEVVEILGEPVTFSTFVSRDYPGKVIVVVRTDERWLGLFGKGSSDGFWVTSDGERIPVTDEDILDFFG